ncbi:MAG: alpha-2-macroglobulin family protein, partial [Planctomycetota bacterium]
GLEEAVRSRGAFREGTSIVDRPDGEGPTRWQDDDVETTAVVLLALLEAGYGGELIPQGAQWLLAARTGGDRWRSTRDTGAAVAFLAAYTAHTGDLGAGRSVALLLDGDVAREIRLTPESVFSEIPVATFEDRVFEPGQVVRVGIRTESGAASAGVALRYHETGPAIAAASNGFSVVRRFHLLERETTEQGVVWTRTPLTETVPSGAVVECELEVSTSREREFVMITSPHVGGAEPLRETAMNVPGRAPATDARVDVRDDTTFFFVTRCGAGTHVFRHTFRATHVGTYTALPAQAELMYFPDVRGNSDGEVWQVTGDGDAGRDGRSGR